MVPSTETDVDETWMQFKLNVKYPMCSLQERKKVLCPLDGSINTPVRWQRAVIPNLGCFRSCKGALGEGIYRPIYPLTEHYFCRSQVIGKELKTVLLITMLKLKAV